MIKLAPNNEAWWRVDMPDRGEDGELVHQPVRFRLRIYTREELKDRAIDRATSNANDVAKAMQRMVAGRTQDEVASALAEAGAAIARMSEDEQVQYEELRDRILGWNPDDIRDEQDQRVPFSTQLRDALLADEARFQALRKGLLEASRGVRPKNSLPGPAGSPAAAQGGVESSYGASPARPN